MDSFSGCFFKMAAHPTLVLILEHPHVTSLHVVLVISFPLKNGLLLRSWRHYNLLFSIKLLRSVAARKWKSNFKWNLSRHHAIRPGNLPFIMHFPFTIIHRALPTAYHAQPPLISITSIRHHYISYHLMYINHATYYQKLISPCQLPTNHLPT